LGIVWYSQPFAIPLPDEETRRRKESPLLGFGLAEDERSKAVAVAIPLPLEEVVVYLGCRFLGPQACKS